MSRAGSHNSSTRNRRMVQCSLTAMTLLAVLVFYIGLLDLETGSVSGLYNDYEVLGRLADGGGKQ